MATSQNHARARRVRIDGSVPMLYPKVKGPTTTPKAKCQVPIAMPGSPLPVMCGDPVVRAGRCAEHLADWKHAKEARRGQPPVRLVAVPLKKHGKGTSASALANKKARADRLVSRRRIA